ncbi:hypothetical protein M378DRAFT_80050 [Amanita muscaria Koide BX008]|uniref:15-cis-phytoene synthase n=1 Tax=Amanita muscaria (strain Koide BX008) TaxID=946122 RepID=A0A0C2SJ26_AMAMK|nr:hypothetical protein M378DRAFT_80050 [Amanita muscaria Koide BX008]
MFIRTTGIQSLAHALKIPSSRFSGALLQQGLNERLQRCYSAESSPGLADPAAYCRELVRKHDYESYLLAAFYPKEAQGGYFAIKAFSVELAMVQDNVSNATIGNMRMQFWRDVIKDCSQGKPPQHPIALALHDAMQRAHLPAYHFKRIIDARDAELHTPTHLTIDSLTSHAESTSSTVLYLLLSLLSLSSSTLSHAASHLGVAQTISTLIRGLPFHARQGRMIIPAEVTSKHGVNQEDVFRHGSEARGLHDAVFEFATFANDHMITARDMFKGEEMGSKVPRRAVPIFLSGIPASNILERLEKVNFNAFDRRIQVRDWRLPWLVWRGYYKGEF